MSSDTYLYKTTRVEIADAVGDGFQGPPLTREDLIVVAKHAHASSEVLLALSSLVEGKRYACLRELWPDLHDLPVNRAQVRSDS